MSTMIASSKAWIRRGGHGWNVAVEQQLNLKPARWNVMLATWRTGEPEVPMNGSFRRGSDRTAEDCEIERAIAPEGDMLTSPRSLLIVALLSLSAISAQARGGSSSVGQSNPGTVDINRTIDPQALVSQVGTIAAVAGSTGSTPVGLLQPDAGPNGLSLATTASGDIPTSNAGTAVLGAVGRDMDECMAAWDTKAHITRARWRQICAETLVEPQI